MTSEPTHHPPFKAWSPDPQRLRDRLAARFHADGYRFPDFAADVIAWRGVRHLTVAALAAEIGVDEAEIVAAEAGDLDPVDAAPALRWGTMRAARDLRQRRPPASDPPAAP